MKTKKADISIETIVIIVILLVFLLVALLTTGIFRKQSAELFSYIYDFMTGK
ncbi:MAG: hypothetical protein AABW64_01740 [Nanoarchaeota archaeon]